MAIEARFSVDVPFGKKAAALQTLGKFDALEQELGFPKPRVIIGSIGAPESRIEADYDFDKIADLEETWAKLNDPRMAAFVEEMAPFVVPGSHKWAVYRVHEG
jgi:hypothetical protein